MDLNDWVVTNDDGQLDGPTDQKPDAYIAPCLSRCDQNGRKSVIVLRPLNPSLAEPGYVLPLQTV